MGQGKEKKRGEKVLVKGDFKITESKNFIRLRVRDPKDFSNLRTIDPGRIGFTKRIIGRPKGKKKTRTQAIILDKRDLGRNQAIGLAKGMRSLRLKRQGKRRKKAKR